MKHNLMLLILVVTSLQCIGQSNRNEVALVIAPLVLDQQSSYQVLYRMELKNEDWSLRSGLRVLVATNKETRSDTVFKNSGSIQSDLSAGLQRKLNVESLDRVYLYVASDAYLNSEFNRKKNETYYGYYWNFGLSPLFGISYEPFSNIRLSLESRADLNVNLQQYDATGLNKDERVSFSPLKRLAVGFGYLF
jgi:hypothetical protein